MKVFIVLIVVLAWLAVDVNCSGAGRAFPLESENYAIGLFQSVNPDIVWDPSNYLVDLAGLYANCRFVGTHNVQEVEQTMPDGSSIVAIIDDTFGDQPYVEDVNEYIRKVLDSWMNSNVYRTKITESQRVGCSVRPACEDRTVVSCLYSPGRAVQPVTTREPLNPTAAPQAYAFTSEQYDAAEFITGNNWDRSHFLENLSGYETDCAMVTASEWQFATATREADKRGMRILGLYGAEQNRGATEPAMERIMRGFKKIPSAARVGCSVIPDCMYGSGDVRHMYVVISCVYEEQHSMARRIMVMKPGRPHY